MTAPTRRAALGALASASALALPAVPAMASPAIAVPDTELFELIAAASAARERYEAATAALEAAFERAENVPPPETLIITEADTRIWNLNAGDPFDEVHIESMRQRQKHRQSRVWTFSSGLADASYVATLDDKDRAVVEIMAASEAREDQLVTALDEWNVMRRAVRDRSGVTAAQERQDALYSERRAVSERVACTRARTLSGMLAKLAFIAPDYDADEVLEFGTGELGTSEQILISVAVDYKLGVEGVQQA
jgi:hypothetical protein